MNLVDYIKSYKDVSLKDCPFNEVDALIFSLMSYFPFDLMQKKSMNSKKITEFLKTYEPSNTSDRKLLDIYVLNTLCNCKRFKGIKFVDFRKKKSKEGAIEQFQAVTIVLKDFIFVSFAGTDATTTGWREDFDMSYLEIVPSEVEAIHYIDTVRGKHPFKPIYLGGHSKGGRLAIRAGKNIYKNNTVQAIFSFDGPNFTDDFYDDKYEEIKHLIYEFAPNESIIGRLIKQRDKIIISSTANLIFQHDGYTWEVEDDHFIHLNEYTKRSNKIVNVINTVYSNFSNETKSILINTLFDLLDRLNIYEFKDEEYNKKIFLDALLNLKTEWKNIPKEERKLVRDVILSVAKIVVLERFKRE